MQKSPNIFNQGTLLWTSDYLALRTSEKEDECRFAYGDIEQASVRTQGPIKKQVHDIADFREK